MESSADERGGSRRPPSAHGCSNEPAGGVAGKGGHIGILRISFCFFLCRNGT